ncbi:MAG: UDP-glucose/GDP-mannose dehydrogenase family protein [Caldilineaceae bacterium]|nr:UDP-glucose/GDP-mannose dehydrogenase family protein [Caldilineaceae bacterium]
MTERISVIGLGKLGLCLAACFAERGFKTLGVDIEERVVNSVNQGNAPWFESGLDDLLVKHGGKTLRATTRHKEAIEQTDVTFVLVATPSNPDGSFSNRFVESALRSLAEALRANPKPQHLFVISSTVMPGSTEASFIPLIEKYSGRKLNQGFSVCYDPDFVALGNVIKGFLRPDLVIIGESNSEAGAQIEAIHHQMCENQPAISRMSIVSAEVAKVCLNAYITTKISFANSVANLCERIPGADVDAITKGIGADKRISPHYFQGGLAFGGTCFPRDTQVYMAVAERYGVQADIIHAVDKVNHYQNQHLAETVLRELEQVENKTVGVLGLAFTPNTPVVVESPAIKLIAELLKHDVRVVAYDSLAIDNARGVFGSAVEYVESAEACLEQAGIAVLTLRDTEIKKTVENFAVLQPLTVVDCWRMIDPKTIAGKMKNVVIGRFQA